MIALSDLIVPLATDDVLATQLDLLTLAGFPATAWEPGSVPRTLLRADTETLADLTQTLANVARGGLIALAQGPWLELLALSHYQVAKKPAVVTQGLLGLTDVGGGGPYTIFPLQLYAASASGLRYQNLTGGTLPKNGNVQLSFQAESPGASYNAPNGSITTLLTPLPGVAVNNPDPGTGSWITQMGTDAESDPSLAARCIQRWSTLGGGSPVATDQYWAITSTPTVTRVQVLENTPTGGQVTLYLAGSSGASSPADAASVSAYIQTVRPLCVTVNVFPASNRVITLVGTVTVKQAFLSSAEAQFQTALTVYAQSLSIGATIYFAKLIDLFMALPNVVNVQLSNPSADVALLSNQVAVFTNMMTWIGV